MIDGVIVKELKRINDERGHLFEILRADWPEFAEIKQVYVTCCNPGYVKAWHYHKKQDDKFAVVNGKAKIVLYDAREESPTKGETSEFVVSEKEPKLIIIPRGVYHGFMALDGKPAYIVNSPNQVYNYKEPDEYRKPFDSEEIGYDWGEGIKGGW
jgi:dTDP-4-dehydrorhamnose 3,5-epimerase